MTVACQKDFGDIESVLATPDMSVRVPVLTRLYDAAVRGMSEPGRLSSEEIQKLCYVFAARCCVAGVPLPARGAAEMG